MVDTGTATWFTRGMTNTEATTPQVICRYNADAGPRWDVLVDGSIGGWAIELADASRIAGDIEELLKAEAEALR